MRLIDGDRLFAEIKERHDMFAECEYIGDKARRDELGAFMADIVNAPTVGGWISTKGRKPESGKHVLATCEIRSFHGYKKRYVCEAFYAEEHSISEGKYPEETDCYDYYEEDDEYYLKEGWYEVIHNWDDYSSVVIGDFVTHWMPLPGPSEEET